MESKFAYLIISDKKFEGNISFSYFALDETDEIEKFKKKLIEAIHEYTLEYLGWDASAGYLVVFK